MEKKKNTNITKETRILNAQFSKNGKGDISPRMSVPKKWLDVMGITQDQKKMEVIFDSKKKQIVIVKCKNGDSNND